VPTKQPLAYWECSLGDRRGVPSARVNAAEQVAPLVREGRIAVVPGVYDVLSAKLAKRAGFPSAVLTGYAVSATYLGEPDFGLLTQSEILDVARRVTAAVDIALIVDADTGYGGPLNVQRMAHELIGMGALGMILEDQRWPKRCGHMRDKEVIDAEEHAAKIRAAVEARGESPFVIVGRTDALEPLGIDEAIRRAALYREAGADVLFVEGPRDRDELRRIASEVEGPKTVNLIEGGKTPMCSLEELAEMGFISVGFVLSGLYASARALERAYAEIRASGSTDAVGDSLMPFDELNELVGLERRYAEDERFRPQRVHE
jgi:2,3-dimethylmalate lyase